MTGVKRVSPANVRPPRHVPQRGAQAAARLLRLPKQREPALR
jgi:hypothetical protein